MSLYQFFSMFHENSIAIPSAASSGDTGPEHAASHFKTTADRPKRDRAKQEDDLSNTRDPDPEVLLHPAVDHEKAGDRHKQNVRPKHDDDRKKTRRVKVPKREACRSLTTLEKLYHDRLSGTTCVDVIVPGGDLILECGPSRTKIEGRVQVASQMLWIVSPVFAALLGPESQRPEAEAVRRANIRGNEPAVVFLQGEFLGAFLWFLGIVFHQRYRDPTSFTWCDLAGVAAVANAYDVAEFLYPWVHKQTENLWESWDDECDTQDLIDQFHVAWTFKHEEIFTTVGNRLARKYQSYPGGKWMNNYVLTSLNLVSLSDISDPSLSYSQNFLIGE
ncbi:hypothetical protein EDC01DRAFT_650404 [Geopyxis carbonaria]|nr:hypothetical protein EDC01DRAFT_650404 [Geopyxis carbonaria]